MWQSNCNNLARATGGLLVLIALSFVTSGPAWSQSKPPAPLTPGQLAQEKAIRAGLAGAWVIPADGTCNSGAPWQFKPTGGFRTERIDGHWRLDGRRLFIAGFDWDLDDKNRQRVTGVSATTWTVVKMTPRRMTLRRKSGKSFTLHRCK